MTSLPAVSLRDRGVIVLLFVALAAFFPYFESIHSANELSRLYLTNAVATENVVHIDTSLDRLGNIHDKAFRDGHHYSDKAPGTSFFAVPAAWLYLALDDTPTLAEEMRVLRLWVSVIPTAFLLLAMLRFLGGYIHDRGLRLWLVTGYALGSLATTYGILLFGHQLSAVLVFGAFLVAHDARPDWSSRRALLMGLMGSAAVCVEYPNVIFMVPVVFYYWRQVQWSPRAIALTVLGALPLLVLLGWYHNTAFGSPWTTGYSYLTSSFKDVHAQGVMGITWPTLDNLHLCFVSLRRGLFVYAPFLLLALPGLLVVGRAGRAGKLALIMAPLYALFVTSMVYAEGGWSVSLRHLTPMVPWLLLPAGLLVQRLRWLRPVLVGLILVSVVVTGLSSVTWPHFQETVENPFFQLTWPLFEHGWLPPSLFGAVGLSSKTAVLWIGGLVALMAIADLCQWSQSLWQCLLSLAVAGGLVWGAWHFASPLHADTEMAKEQRWVQSVYEPDPLGDPQPFPKP